MKKKRTTQIRVDYEYFKQYFEPQRRAYSKKYGSSLSQVKFSKIMLNEFKNKKRRKRKWRIKKEILQTQLF